MNKYKHLLIIILISFICGCAEIGQVRQSIAEYGQNGADQALESAAWTICIAASTGSIERKFNTAEKRRRHREFCEVFRGASIEPGAEIVSHGTITMGGDNR